MNRYSLLMLPGLDGTGIMFQPIIDELKAHVDPIVVSYSQKEECSYPKLTDYVSTLLPQNEYFILGESFSGPIALMLADRKPEGLKGIILCATFISNPSALFPSLLSFLVRAPLFSVWPVSVKAKILTGGRSDDRIEQLIQDIRGKATNTAMAARAREAMKVNVSEELRRSEYPMLYLRGARDIIVGSHNLKKIQAIKGEVSDVTLDTSHLVLQEAPRDSAEAIQKFIKTTTEQGS
jgi:pimeloyl-[acyl-carrier protein] methyl ester esterase